MSLQSSGSTSESSENGRPPAADESSSSESSEYEETERRASKDESTRSTRLEDTNIELEDEKNEHSIDKNATNEMKGYRNKDYRDLLNAVIAEAAGDSHPESENLYPSQIGSSYWTSVEKEAFFQVLAAKGRDDLPGISRAIRTKTQLEVRTYLLALQTACSDGQAPSPAASDTSSLDTPAAYEIGEHCDNAVIVTAEALEQQVLKRDIRREKRKFRDLWLIDEDVAAKVELHQQQKSLAEAFGDDKEVTEISDDSVSQFGPENEVIEIQSDTDYDRSGSSGALESITAAKLLQPQAFIHLSRSLFMNSSTDSGSNWSQLESVDDEPPAPAIFRSAFDSFNNVAINYTRWIVQATVFQAFSRLRAKDDQNPADMVTTEDVRTAINLLNLEVDRNKYWAGVARRCGVEVYSDSDKYRDGRPGTRNGRLLTFDEVETELGFPPSEQSRKTGVKMADEDEEGASSTSSDEREEVSDQEVDSSEDEDDPDPDEETAGKRKRSASFSSNEDAEDKRLDATDEEASRAEERRLLAMLRYEEPDSSEKLEQASGVKDTKCRKRVKVQQQSDWREHVDYMAPWEQQRIWMENSTAGDEDR